MKRLAITILLVVVGYGCGYSVAAATAVNFVNASRPTHCAEEDNVYVKVLGADVSSFRIRAEHPPYIAAIRNDSTEPDFTTCDMSHDPTFSFAPRDVILYEDKDIRLVGHTFANFWRPDVVDFRVGDKHESGLHLVQLIKRTRHGDIEILVVYPSDGYWRVKPLPPAALTDTAYGSSFLFGPIEGQPRPYVSIRSIEFDPSKLRFRLAFRDGTRGVLTVTDATPANTRLSLALAPPVAIGRPFAALRSMFVTPEQADVAVAAWRRNASRPASAPILEFSKMHASLARFGRILQSHHNLSAPDLVFDEFATVHSR